MSCVDVILMRGMGAGCMHTSINCLNLACTKDICPHTRLQVEADGSNPAKEKAVRKHLGMHGYRYIETLGHKPVMNDWFVREGFLPVKCE